MFSNSLSPEGIDTIILPYSEIGGNEVSRTNCSAAWIKKKKKDCGLYYQTVEMASSGYWEETAAHSLWDLSRPIRDASPARGSADAERQPLDRQGGPPAHRFN